MLIKDYMAKIGKYRAHIMGFCILDVLIESIESIHNAGDAALSETAVALIDVTLGNDGNSSAGASEMQGTG